MAKSTLYILGVLDVRWIDERCRSFCVIIQPDLKTYVFRSGSILSVLNCTQEDYDLAATITKVESTYIDCETDPAIKSSYETFMDYWYNNYETNTNEESQTLYEPIWNILAERQTNDKELNLLRTLHVTKYYEDSIFEEVQRYEETDENVAVYKSIINNYKLAGTFK